MLLTEKKDHLGHESLWERIRSHQSPSRGLPGSELEPPVDRMMTLLHGYAAAGWLLQQLQSLQLFVEIRVAVPVHTQSLAPDFKVY